MTIHSPEGLELDRIQANWLKYIVTHPTMGSRTEPDRTVVYDVPPAVTEAQSESIKQAFVDFNRETYVSPWVKWVWIAAFAGVGLVWWL